MHYFGSDYIPPGWSPGWVPRGYPAPDPGTIPSPETSALAKALAEAEDTLVPLIVARYPDLAASAEAKVKAALWDMATGFGTDKNPPLGGLSRAVTDRLVPTAFSPPDAEAVDWATREVQLTGNAAQAAITRYRRERL